MFRITEDPSSGSLVLCLAKNYKNDSIVSVDVDILMMYPLWSETCWSTFKYFIILIVSTNYILCISWIIKCLLLMQVQTWSVLKLSPHTPTGAVVPTLSCTILLMLDYYFFWMCVQSCSKNVLHTLWLLCTILLTYTKKLNSQLLSRLTVRNYFALLCSLTLN